MRSRKDKGTYLGCTNNLKSRIDLHNKGKILSTALRKPFKLIYYEAFIDKNDAFRKEQWLKTGWGRNHLRKMLHNSLKI
jgi:putative endonuclease